MTTPASRARAIAAPGSSECQATSVVSSRATGSRPASRSACANPAASACARARPAEPDSRSSSVSDASEVASAAAVKTGESCRAAPGGQRRVDAAAVALGEGHVARRDARHPLLQRGGDVQAAGRLRAAQPLLPRCRVGGGADRRDVHLDRADPLRTVVDDRHVERGQLVHRRHLAVHPADVRERHQPRPRPDGASGLGQRHLPHVDAAVARGAQRAEQPRVLGVAGHDLVAAAEFEPGDHLPDPLAGPGRDRDVRGRHVTEQPCVAAAQLRQHLRLALERRDETALGQLAFEFRTSRLDRDPRQRPIRPRVEVRGALEDGEVGAQRFDVHHAPAP